MTKKTTGRPLIASTYCTMKRWNSRVPVPARRGSDTLPVERHPVEKVPFAGAVSVTFSITLAQLEMSLLSCALNWADLQEGERRKSRPPWRLTEPPQTLPKQAHLGDLSLPPLHPFVDFLFCEGWYLAQDAGHSVSNFACHILMAPTHWLSLTSYCSVLPLASLWFVHCTNI